MRPVLFHFLNYSVFSYPLFVGISFGLAYLVSKYLILNNSGSVKGFNKLFIGIFISSWLGAKAFYLLHSSDQYISSLSFWFGGGLVFNGGLIFASVFTLIYCLVLKKFDFNSLAWAIPALPLAHAFGRIGCFLTGCCYGSICDLPWKIYLHGEFRHPVQLYEAFANLIIFLILLKIQKRSKKLTLYFYFISYGFIRFILEFFRGDLIRGSFSNFSSSQWSSIAIVIVTSLLLLRSRVQTQH